jgi:hypothetical protein
MIGRDVMSWQGSGRRLAERLGGNLKIPTELVPGARLRVGVSMGSSEKLYLPILVMTRRSVWTLDNFVRHRKQTNLMD